MAVGAARPAIRRREPARAPAAISPPRTSSMRRGWIHAAAGLPRNAVNATLYQKLSYNFIRDIAPVASISREPLGWRCIRHFRRRRFPNSSPTPRPIRASSAWLRPASGLRLTWPANYSCSWPASTWCTCPIGLGAGAHRSAGRPGADDVRPLAVVDRVRQGRQTARAWRSLPQRAPRRCPTSRPSAIRAGLSGNLLLRRRRAPKGASARSSKSSTKRSMRALQIRSSRRGLPILAAYQHR